MVRSFYFLKSVFEKFIKKKTYYLKKSNACVEAFTLLGLNNNTFMPNVIINDVFDS